MVVNNNPQVFKDGETGFPSTSWLEKNVSAKVVTLTGAHPMGVRVLLSIFLQWRKAVSRSFH